MFICRLKIVRHQVMLGRRLGCVDRATGESGACVCECVQMGHVGWLSALIADIVDWRRCVSVTSDGKNIHFTISDSINISHSTSPNPIEFDSWISSRKQNCPQTSKRIFFFFFLFKWILSKKWAFRFRLSLLCCFYKLSSTTFIYLFYFFICTFDFALDSLLTVNRLLVVCLVIHGLILTCGSLWSLVEV